MSAKTWKAEEITSAGGLATLKSKTDPHTTGVVQAVLYTHPGIGGRTIVRLAEESLSRAIDAEMNALGFEPEGTKTPVGRGGKQALGFPAWALVHHPDKASFALDVMRDFRKASARAKTKPGHARDAFAEIGKRLERSVPDFMPSFWEQVGRVFLAEDAAQMAGQSFEKARTAERAFNLQVDEDRRADAYLEFAGAGALPAKSFVGYAADLSAAFGDQEAAQRFVRLNVQRIKAGLPPWTGMSKEIRKLTKKAKNTHLEEEMLAEVAGAPALRKAAPDFWTSYRAPLVKLAKASAEVRQKLMFLFPTPRQFEKFMPGWLDLLTEIGAVEAANEGPPEEAIRFLQGLTKFVTSPALRALPPRYYELMAQLAPRLIAHGQPLSLPRDSWNDASFSPDVLETALELGLPLAVPTSDRAEVYYYLGFEKEHFKLVAHPGFHPLVVKGVANAFGRAEFEESARGKRALAEIRRDYILRQIERLKQGALPVFRETLQSMRYKISAPHFQEFPETAAALQEISVGAALGRTIRGGILEELAWPAFEAALREFGQGARIELHGSLLHPILRAGTRVIVFEGRERLREYDLPQDLKLEELLFIDGDLLVQVSGWPRRGMWMSHPERDFEMDALYGGYIYKDAIAPSGGTTFGGEILRSGDVPKTITRTDFSSDGETFWRPEHEASRFKLVELDLTTQKKGRASWPAIFQPLSELDDGAQITWAALNALPKARESLCGFHQGLVGAVVRTHATTGARTFTRVDGVQWSGPEHNRGSVNQLRVDWPLREEDGDRVVVIDGSPSWSRTSDDRFMLYADGAYVDHCEHSMSVDGHGFLRLPRFTWVHYLSVRDAEGSKILRGITDEAVTAALDALVEQNLDASTQHAATVDAIAKHLPPIADPVLRLGLARVLRIARTEALSLASLLPAEKGELGDGPDDYLLRESLRYLPTQSWNRGHMVADMRAAAAAFDGDPGALTCSCIHWELAADQLVALGCFFAARETDETKRAAILEALQGFAASGLMGRTLTAATLEIKIGSPLLQRGGKDVWFHEVGGKHWLLRSIREDSSGGKHLVSALTEGELTLPSDATIVSSRSYDVPDQSDFIAEFIKELQARGPVPFSVEAGPYVAERSALSEVEAKLLLAGLPNFEQNWVSDFLGKELRAALDVKMQDAKRARQKLKELSDGQRKGLLLAMGSLPSPSSFWADAHAEDSAAAALIKAANQIFEDRVEIPNALIDLVAKNIPRYGTSPQQALTMLLQGDDQAFALTKITSPQRSWNEMTPASGGMINACSLLLRLLSLHLPVGDPFRSALPRWVRKLAARLQETEILIDLDTYYEEEKSLDAIVEKFGGEPFVFDPKQPTLISRDNGEVIAWRRHTTAMVLKVRVQQLSAYLKKREQDGYLGHPLAVDYVLSEACAQMLERIEETPLAAGAYEANPLESAKELVLEAAEALDLSEDAAALYLQLLTLPNPNKKFVMEINGWKSARYKKAADALVAKELVVEGKRARAGRDIFLPGAWEKNVGGIPMEAYRAKLYPPCGMVTPLLAIPAHLAFAKAWERWSSGDKPGFEDVTKKPKKTTKSPKK